MISVADHLNHLKAEIPAHVQVIAVAKRQPLAKIEAALDAGHRVFGENRVEEAADKWPALKQRYPDVELHMVGQLQSKKAAQAVELFDVIHTVDRPSLVDALLKTGQSVRCFVQVNTGEEDQKGGIMPAQADAFIEACGLPIEGLMCIPPVDDNPALHFCLLSEMAKRHTLPSLSMGMSGDYQTAIRYGATHIRLGTAIFGKRSKT